LYVKRVLFLGTKGREIVGDQLDNIINSLNKALADEWLAYYQYWIGAKVIKGPMKEAVLAELIEHANDEFRHAGLLADRIMELGGQPILVPDEWSKKSNCGYDAPQDSFVKKILEQNIKGEQCAIMVYQKLLKQTKDIDLITYDIIVEILKDEVKHEEDLESLQEDIELISKQ